MKGCSVSLATGELWVKTTIIYHFTPDRMAIINKSPNNKCWWGCGKKRTLVDCWWESRLVQPLRNTVWNFLKNLKMELLFDPGILLLGLYPKNPVLLGIHPKNPEMPIQTNLCTTMFITVLFTIAKCWKQFKCPPVNEWIKKPCFIYTMEYYAAERKNSYPSRQHG